ncbi:protein tyrosine kinase [Tieghemostelium lacteum]|uniref:non-specific serine/threonine protein kinase n=1 Tax=Tieghemostelium lacteum TaxID=361077 RepID=A0A151ZI99_TIELA|nr:protein tyrosine kinase [Tieghemostelium lacteum]|eukprot:KYQ93712.1 protein tyrosine kinase [Tieghemostelium lacteum]
MILVHSRYQFLTIIIYIFILLYCNNFILAFSSSSSSSSSSSNSNNIDSTIPIDKEYVNEQQTNSNSNSNNNNNDNDKFIDLILDRIEIGGDTGGDTSSGDNVNHYSLTLQNSSISINISGGDSTCTATNCTAKNSQFFTNFACSDCNGNWSQGAFTFHDPVPLNSLMVIKKVTMIVYGNFVLTNASYPILVTIGTNLVSYFQPPIYADQSSCPSCVVPLVPSSYISYSNGLPNYNYGQPNTISFNSLAPANNTGVICLSGLELIFYYGAVNYKVLSLMPPSTSAQTPQLITVVGSNFYLYDNIICKFGNNSVSATYINSSTLTCTTPTIDIKVPQLVVDFQVSEDGGTTFAAPINFTFFLQSETTTQTSSSHDTTKEPNNNNYNENAKRNTRILIILTTIGGTSLILSIFAFYYCYKRYKNGRSFIPVGSKSEISPLLKTDYKTLFEIKPIDIGEIVIQNRIGRGSCAEVFTGTWRGITVAIKKAKLLNDDDEEFLNELAQEATIMSQLRHPNICQFLGTCKNPPEILIVMEYMPMGSLYRILHDNAILLDWNRMKSMVLDIAKGMNYLHCCDPIVIHRDLKSHNLLVDEHFRVKISDFGLSTRFKKHLDRSTTMTPVGTPAWSAPEVIRNQNYSEKADVYSFGIVLWECATRMDPYAGLPTFQVICAVGKEGLRPPTPKSAPPEFIRLIIDCWSENPSQRPSFQEIVKRLESIDTKGWGDIPFVKFNPLNNINILQNQQQQQFLQQQLLNNNNNNNNNNNISGSANSNPNIIINNLIPTTKK